MPRRQAPVKLKVASLKTLSDATFEILGQFFRRVVSILAPNGVKKIAELGNSLRRLHYLHPLQGKYELRIDQLTQLASNEMVASQKKRYEKELKHLNLQLAEIIKYDPLIQHIANQKIELDLDDGVVVNYDKLQDGSTILSKLK